SRDGKAEESSDDEMLRPLLKTLVDVYDALALARREVQRMQKTLDELLVRTTGTVAPLESAGRDIPTVRIKPWRDWWLALTGRPVPPPTSSGLENRLAELENELAGYRQAEAARSQV